MEKTNIICNIIQTITGILGLTSIIFLWYMLVVNNVTIWN